MPPWMEEFMALRRLTSVQRVQLQAFVALLQKWNVVHRLIGPSDNETIWDKHIADSLGALPMCESAQTLVDLGCGAGLPGIVLAIACPALQVRLIDAAHKKIAFCQTAIRELGLANATAQCARVESLETIASAVFADVVISRATWALADYLPLALPYCVPGGTIIAMKGAKWEEEIAAAQGIIAQQQLELLPQIYYTLPYSNDARHIIVMRR